MDKNRKLKLGVLIVGKGLNRSSWRHREMPSDASENIDFYIQQAKFAEDAKFETLFLVDKSHVGPDDIPYYLRMFDGATLMSAIAMATNQIGLSFTASSSYSQKNLVNNEK